MKTISLFKWLTTMLVTVLFVIFTYFWASAPSGSQNPVSQVPSFCQNLTPKMLEQIAQINKSLIKTDFGFLAGGTDRMITISQTQNNNINSCAYLTPVTSNFSSKNDFQSVPILSANDVPNTNQTQLTVQLPDLGWGWHRRNLIVVGSSIETQANQAAIAPTANSQTSDRKINFVSSRSFWFSHRHTSLLIALTSLALLYGLACLAGERLSQNRDYHFGKLFLNPVALTSGRWGKASLTLFLLLFFTLIVLYRTVYLICRNGFLSGLSNDVLLLLGLSAAGAGGAKLLFTTKRRFSFENWAWLRKKRWLTAEEKGWEKEPKVDKARWGDLIKVDGFFDVYSFQLLSFSLMIAINLLIGIGDLATFIFPVNYATLLGLSNVFYLGGRAVDPASYEELDKSVTKLREMEEKLLNDYQTQEEAKNTSDYRKYLELAEAVAEMLQSLFGKAGTFADGLVTPEKLKPNFPN